MSSASRSAILNRIRAANSTSDRLSEWNSLRRDYRVQGLMPEAERIQLFEERVRHYNATPFYSKAAISADIARILTQRGKQRLIVAPAVPEEWLPETFQFIRDDGLSKQELDSAEGVITPCALGIALTGTVVIESSPTQGRRATTLIPDYHLCILGKQDIVELVPEAIRRLESGSYGPLTFISGPSATVDIEMTRVRGVHGPRTLDILLI